MKVIRSRGVEIVSFHFDFNINILNLKSMFFNSNHKTKSNSRNCKWWWRLYSKSLPEYGSHILSRFCMFNRDIHFEWKKQIFFTQKVTMPIVSQRFHPSFDSYWQNVSDSFIFLIIITWRSNKALDIEFQQFEKYQNEFLYKFIHRFEMLKVHLKFQQNVTKQKYWSEIIFFILFSIFQRIYFFIHK
jgi:hypothetical protein